MNKDFTYFVKMAKSKVERKGNSEYSNIILENILRYINKELAENSTADRNEVLDKLKDDVNEYLKDVSQTIIKGRTIEYYLSRKMFSKECNVRTSYKNIIDKEKKKKIDILGLSEEELEGDFPFNLNLAMDRMVLIVLNYIRDQLNKLEKYEAEEIGYLLALKTANSRDRKKIINRITDGDKEKIDNINELLNIVFKNESELVEEKVKELTEEASKLLKHDCIVSITKSTKLLDKVGLMQEYTNMENAIYKNSIRLSNYSFTYEEVMKSLSEENLKKLNIDQLILLSSFWTNRVNKVIEDMNTAFYIIENPELYKYEKDENGDTCISISKEDLKNVELKMEVLHKIFFDIFDEINLNTKKDGSTIKINKFVDEKVANYEKEYKAFFNTMLFGSKNNLKEDLISTNIFENTRYNSYKIKGNNMQAILVSLFNSSSKNVENYGYIEDKYCNNKFVLVGVDMKGFNMPLRLHVPKDLLIDVLKEVQDGSTYFPIYNSPNDFTTANGRHISTQIYMPLSSEKEKTINEIAKKADKNRQYEKTYKQFGIFNKKR